MRRVILIAVVVALAAGTILFVRARSSSKAAGAAREQAQAASRPVPVVTAQVQERDVPIYLDGLGNVIAFKTVTVRTQVDGRLDEVYFREGQAVRRGDRLAQIDPRPFQNQLHQAEGALNRDKSQLAEARLNLERYQSLVAKKLIAQQQADDQKALVGQLEGSAAIDGSQIDAARLNLDYANIRAPIDGVTGVRQIDPGNVVHPGDANGLVILTQLDPIAVLFALPQDELPHVMTELAKAPLEVEAWSRDGLTRLATGRLALVDNQINAATSTLRLKAVFPNPQKLLWPGQFVKARLLLTTRKKALVVPSTVPQRGPEGTFAYVVDEEQNARPQNIEVDLTQGEISVVSRGLQAGQTVVVDGQSQLRAGSKVAARQQGAPQREHGAPAGGSAKPDGTQGRGGPRP